MKMNTDSLYIEEIEDELFIREVDRLCRNPEEQEKIKKAVRTNKQSGNQIKGTHLLKIRVPLK